MNTQFSSIWPIDRTLSSTITPSQSVPGSDGSKEVLRIPQNSSITGALPSNCRVSYSGHSLEGVLPLCRDSVSIFYSSGRLGFLCHEGGGSRLMYVHIYIFLCCCSVRFFWYTVLSYIDNLKTYMFDLQMEPLQILPLRIKVGQEVLAIKGYSTLIWSPKLWLQHQIKFSVIPLHLFFLREGLPLGKWYCQHTLNPTDRIGSLLLVQSYKHEALGEDWNHN